MWRLFNKLFGWDYVAFEYGDKWYIRRANKTLSGKVFVMIDFEPMFLCKSDSTRMFVPLTYIDED